MSKNTSRIITCAAALMISLSLAPAIMGSARAAEGKPSPAPYAPQSIPRHDHHHGKDGKLHAGGHFILRETAKLLEMEDSALIDSIKAGKTLPQLALEKKGWTEDQYVQKLAESAGKHLDEAVRQGRLTSVEAEKLKEQLPVILKLKISNMGKMKPRQ